MSCTLPQASQLGVDADVYVSIILHLVVAPSKQKKRAMVNSDGAGDAEIVEGT